MRPILGFKGIIWFISLDKLRINGKLVQEQMPWLIFYVRNYVKLDCNKFLQKRKKGLKFLLIFRSHIISFSFEYVIPYNM